MEVYDEDQATPSAGEPVRTSEAATWQRVKELLGEVLELDPGERPPFLDEKCAGKDSLRQEVERLLAVAGEMGDFIEDPIVSLRLGPATAAQGRRVGRYEIRQEIGRGGVGTVYLAVRADDTFEKRVALKVLKRGMDTDEIVRRFRNERQILAHLEHPHIARLLDGGSTEDGLPYLVMEYVEGERIDRYCDTHRLSISCRLELFLTVCAAVSRAHQSLVVHRDLKPGNILVTTDGEPKLLDFGIAKVLGSDGASYTTTDGFRLMTPEYASPEQLRGDSVTTATDVYSLGVVLYELLTGDRPYHLETRSEDGLARAIVAADPLRPSVAVTRAREHHTPQGRRVEVTPEQISAPREGDPERLRRRLAGDLDAIALTALAKEPAQRYASVERFAEDVERHLSGRPVHARPRTLAYRTRRFVHRNLAAVVAAGIFVVLTLAFALFQWQQSNRLAEALETARQERRKAEGEATKARRIADFLAGLFDNANPDQTQGQTMTVREVLDRGAERIHDDLEEQAETQADLMNTMGRAYRGLGFYDEARELLEESLAVRRVACGGAHPNVATSLQNLANLLHKMGEYRLAEQHLRESLSMLRQLHDGAHPETARALNSLAQVLKARGDFNTAEPLLRESLEIKRQFHGDDHRDVATGLNSLASLLAKLEDHTAAEPYYREALDIRTRLYGPRHLDVARVLNNLAATRKALGDLAEAESLWNKALEVRRGILGDDHPDVATILGNLAILNEDQGDLETAEALNREVLGIRIRRLGEPHPYVAVSRNNLANVLALQGEYGEARELFQEALSALREKLGDRHVDVASVQRNLAWLLSLQGDHSAAEELIQEALTILDGELPDGHWRVADARSVLGGCLAAQGRLEEAEPLLRESLEALERAEGLPSRYLEEARERLKALPAR